MHNDRISTTIDINQLISWENSKELIKNPVYQRNKVWNENAKSYLIDSIMRNYPIPPIFIREKLNLFQRKTLREVVDGQQRISAILDFYNNKFSIKKSHNRDLGGKCFRDFSEEQQEIFLTYKIYLEKLTEKDDSVIFDMFARLNSNSVPLNAQELRNAKFTGEFKVAAYDFSIQFREFFVNKKSFKKPQLSRMLDVDFISMIMCEIINSGPMDITKAVLDKCYSKHNDNFLEYQDVSNKMHYLLNELQIIFGKLQDDESKFVLPVYLYDLIWYLLYEKEADDNFKMDYQKIIIALQRIDMILNNQNEYLEDPEFKKYFEYKELHGRHTNTKSDKNKRILFLRKEIDG